MSNVFAKFCLEINYKPDSAFKNIKVIRAQLQEDHIFKIIFQNMETIPFAAMLGFIKKINDNFKYKSDLFFEIISPNYQADILKDYVKWIIKDYLHKPLLANIFLQNATTISASGECVVILSNVSLLERFRLIKSDLERIMRKFGFALFTLEAKLKAQENILENEFLAIKKAAQESFIAPKATTPVNHQPVNTYRTYEYCEIHEIAASGFSKIATTGVIFKKEEFKTKTGLMIITMGLTNNTDAIELKIFAKSDKQIMHYKNFEIGNVVDVRGDYQIDAFSKKPIIICSTIKESTTALKVRNDTAKGLKRVELGAHTRMSTMDGLVSASELVNRALAWGHKAIAIVDSASVQSFPEFYLATKNKPIKPIYGVSLPTLPRLNQAVFNATKREFKHDKYIVFDLETTGLSPRANDLIEFGAVKIVDGQIIDKKQFFIKPTHKIPEKITAITNINDSMVANGLAEKEALESILAYFEDYTLVAHNASFDYGFLEEKLHKYNLKKLTNPCLDTLVVARLLQAEAKKFRLEIVAKRYGVPYDSTIAHRADYDADVLARIWLKMIFDLEAKGIFNQAQLLAFNSPELYQKQFTHEVTILAKNQTGLKDLFKLVSLASTTQLFKKPTIFYDQLAHQPNLLIGSSALKGKVHDLMLNGSTNALEQEIKKYDYIEVLPLSDYQHLLSDYNLNDIKAGIKLVLELAQKHEKIVVATGDVRYLDPDEKIFHEIYINAKGLGGAAHYLKKFNVPNPVYPDQFLRTTAEMKAEFSWLSDADLIEKIVVTNSLLIADKIDDNIQVIKEKLYTPTWDDAVVKLKAFVYDSAFKIYGNPLPKIVLKRLEREIKPIEKHGFGIIYWISHLLVSKSLADGYLVGSRGSVGSSLIATLANITEVNPLDPHYLCEKCKYSEFFPDSELNSGYDLPTKKCPQCHTILKQEGQKIPFETFLGFDADKVPDIDLNFSGEYQPIIHQEVKKIFGDTHAFRAGTISTVAEKTAFGYVKSWAEETNRDVSYSFIDYLAKKVAGTKRTTGQHPGGIIVIPQTMNVEDFTPINFPANDKHSDWKTTHFDFHAIHDNVLKLDLLGHDDPTAIKYLEKLTGIDAKRDIPFKDPKVIDLFSSTQVLGIKPEDIDGETTGAMGIPEFGTNFVRRMLTKAQVTSFGDLIALSGLSHGTDVWAGNAEKIIKEQNKKLSEVISCRDNIMTDLIAKHVEPLTAFKIMEKVRKGKGLSLEEENLLKAKNVEPWYIDSLQKIKYMFPKAHATAYVMMAWRIAWFKIYYPEAYYATYFTARSDVFDLETILQGQDVILETLQSFKKRKNKRGPEGLSNKEIGLIPIYELALEACARGIKIGNIDMHKSLAAHWIISPEKILIPPFSAIDGLGQAAADSIVKARSKMLFTSIEDIQKRTSLNKTNMDKLKALGVLKNFSNSNQLEFDFFGL